MNTSVKALLRYIMEPVATRLGVLAAGVLVGTFGVPETTADAVISGGIAFGGLLVDAAIGAVMARFPGLGNAFTGNR